MDLHNLIMNIAVKYKEGEFLDRNDYVRYKEGHRDARHSAAELSLKAEARIEELETSNKVNVEDCNEAERILRNIIKEWSCSGDVFGAIQQAKEFLK